ncbi:hypothetical protein [Calothrix sp. NIES-2100]|uniref:hypothetical protein n=1 Tax=Calothrix sp. NIES-2100 TaxID=1954172 RepID=UPI0030DD7D16
MDRNLLKISTARRFAFSEVVANQLLHCNSGDGKVYMFVQSQLIQQYRQRQLQAAKNPQV